MDRWAHIYGRDPRSKDDALQLDVTGQTNLLRWAKNDSQLTAAAPPGPRLGRPRALHTTYLLEHGGSKIKGHTLDYVLQNETWFIGWVLGGMQRSDRYIWNFPRDEYLFMGLLELDGKGMEIEFYEGTDRCTMLRRAVTRSGHLLSSLPLTRLWC